MAFSSMCEMLGFEIETYDPPPPLFSGSLMIRIKKLRGFSLWHLLSVSPFDY